MGMVMNSAINLFGSLHSPGFPICVHRQSNAYVSFCPFVYKVAFSRKPSKCKGFFQNSFILDKKALKNKINAFFSKQTFITILHQIQEILLYNVS